MADVLTGNLVFVDLPRRRRVGKLIDAGFTEHIVATGARTRREV